MSQIAQMPCYDLPTSDLAPTSVYLRQGSLTAAASSVPVGIDVVWDDSEVAGHSWRLEGLDCPAGRCSWSWDKQIMAIKLTINRLDREKSKDGRRSVSLVESSIASGEGGCVHCGSIF